MTATVRTLHTLVRKGLGLFEAKGDSVPGKGHACSAVLVLAALVAAPVAAQTPAEGPVDLMPGTRIRVTVTDPPPPGVTDRKLVGVFDGWDDQGALRIAPTPSETRALPRDVVVSVERSVRPSRKTRGALIGFAVGLAAVVGKAALQGGCNDGCNEANVAAAVLLGASTAVVGAIAAPGEVWAKVPLAGGSGSLFTPAAGPPPPRTHLPRP